MLLLLLQIRLVATQAPPLNRTAYLHRLFLGPGVVPHRGGGFPLISHPSHAIHTSYKTDRKPEPCYSHNEMEKCQCSSQKPPCSKVPLARPLLSSPRAPNKSPNKPSNPGTFPAIPGNPPNQAGEASLGLVSLPLVFPDPQTDMDMSTSTRLHLIISSSSG